MITSLGACTTSGEHVVELRTGDDDHAVDVTDDPVARFNCHVAHRDRSVDRAGLSRAFSTLDAQQVTFDKCDIQVSGSVGNATCVGTAMWLPKIGGQTRELARTWKFVLKNAAGAWQIVTSESR